MSQFSLSLSGSFGEDGRFNARRFKFSTKANRRLNVPFNRYEVKTRFRLVNSETFNDYFYRINTK